AETVERLLDVILDAVRLALRVVSVAVAPVRIATARLADRGEHRLADLALAGRRRRDLLVRLAVRRSDLPRRLVQPVVRDARVGQDVQDLSGGVSDVHTTPRIYSRANDSNRAHSARKYSSTLPVGP